MIYTLRLEITKKDGHITVFEWTKVSNLETNVRKVKDSYRSCPWKSALLQTYS
jgi:hypothetical protein